MTEPYDPTRHRPQDSYPALPDPATVTTVAILRDVAALRDLVFTRLDAMDKAIVIFNDNLTRVPTDVDKQVGNLKEIMMGLFMVEDEKFAGIQVQFKERDTRSERESRDNKVAVDAAFAAQKEAASEQNKSNTLAIDKSEKATAETLNKQADLFKSTTDGLAGQISDLKDRQNKAEGTGRGMASMWGYVLGAVGLVAVLLDISSRVVR
jgi:hypothetical protein